jgi:hypothetical protein
MAARSGRRCLGPRARNRGSGFGVGDNRAGVEATWSAGMAVAFHRPGLTRSGTRPVPCPSFTHQMTPIGIPAHSAIRQRWSQPTW